MRLVRKLLLSALLVAMATAFAAASSSAQTVEVYQEVDGQQVHCSAVTLTNHVPAGGCSFHAVGGYDVYLHSGTSEFLFAECQSEFEARIAEDGEGYIYNQVLAPEGSVCSREPCDEAETGANPHRNVAWAFHIEEAGAGGNEEETLTYTFCFYAHSFDPAREGLPGAACQTELDVIRIGHDYEFATHPHAGSGNGGSPCVNTPQFELVGSWLTLLNESHPHGIEIIHHNDQRR